MKNILILILTILTFTLHAQKLAEIGKIYERKDIDVTNGMTYRYYLGADTARYYHPPQEADGTPHRISVLVIFTDLDADTIPPVQLDTVVFDDADPSSVISGSVVKTSYVIPSNPFFMNTFTRRVSLSAPGAVQFEFTGVGFDWRGERNLNHGEVILTVDGVENRILLNVPPYANDIVLFSQRGMENKKHTIRIVADQGQFVHDRWVIYTEK